MDCLKKHKCISQPFTLTCDIMGQSVHLSFSSFFHRGLLEQRWKCLHPHHLSGKVTLSVEDDMFSRTAELSYEAELA